MIYGDIFLIILEIVLCVICYFLAGYATVALNSKWKLIFALPSIVCIAGLAGVGFEISLIGAYIGSFLMLIGFFCEAKNKRQITAIASALLIALSFPAAMLYKGYRAPDYLAEFEEGFNVMKEHYDMTEQKAIDWDALYDKYKPEFAKVNKSHDEVENFILWTQFCNEFHDGHVGYNASEEIVNKAMDNMYGNDYGLSLVRGEDGSILAVNVEPDGKASKEGIKNGTRIITWDNIPVEQLIQEFDLPLYMGTPVKENEEFLKPIHAAGQGGESVEVGFVDDTGATRTVRLEKTGTYRERLIKTLDLIMAGRIESNLTVTRLDENTACLRLSEMIYDSRSSENGDYNTMYEELKAKLEEQKKDGVTNLVIDLRSNHGGDPGFITQIFKLLSPEGEHKYAYSGVWDDEKKEFMYDEATGKYVVGECTTYEGENLWGDGQIVLLVNAFCISAGDHFTEVMSVFDNVTVMGFTTTNCSGQAVRGVQFEKGILQFSTVPTLNEDGSIFIDTGVDRTATIELDVKIPFDETAAKAVFDEERDYAMEYVLDFIE